MGPLIRPGNIIIPGAFQATATPFRDLLGTPRDAHRVAMAMERALALSFAEDERRHGSDARRRMQTDSEVRRRTELLADAFRKLRGDLGYSIAQVCDELPRWLQATLDQDGSYAPPEPGRLYGPHSLTEKEMQA